MILVTLFGVYTLPHGIDSVYDEGYLFLTVKSALEGKIVGATQSPVIIAELLGDSVCSSILYMRIVRFCLTLLSGFIFFAFTFKLICKPKESWIYLILCFLMLSPCLMHGLVISYNQLALFFQCTSIALFVIIIYGKKRWKFLSSFVLGVCLLCSVFVILPSAILLAVSLLLLLIYRFKADVKLLIEILVGIGIGIGVGGVFFNYCIMDLDSVFREMSIVADNIQELDRGYDLRSFIIKLLLFFRNWVLMCITLIGIITVSYKLQKYSWNFIGGIFFILLSLIYYHYQKDPVITFSMFMSIMLLICVFNKQNGVIFNSNPLGRIDFDDAFNIFLLFTPIILSLGTNTFIGGKMGYFLLPWAILLYRWGFCNVELNFRFEVVFIIVLLLATSGFRLYNAFAKEIYYIDNGPLKGMYLPEVKYKHFSLCDSIMSQYAYERRKSVIYSNQLGMMTVCYLDAVNCANYFQPMDFLKYSKTDSLMTPDFLILSDFDEKVSGNAIKEYGWGWPNEFDKFYIGTPESGDYGYSTDRWLYCRKKNMIYE